VSWAYAYAFRAGAGKERCDDVCICETLGDTLIAAVADGAGSAEQAHAGASLACEVFLQLGVQVFSGTVEASCLLEAIQARIPEGENDAYACTLVGAVADSRRAMILQIGDGAAVVSLRSPPSEYEVALWPEETEFLNHTFFATASDADQHLQLRRLDAPPYEVALFSDGLQLLILDPKAKVPHQPFFRTVFKPLKNEPGHDVKASWWLERQIGSEHVTKRTDDDTSIVLARRLS